MFEIKPIEKLKHELLTQKQQLRNFPKSAQFLFDNLYNEIVTQIKTIEISAECILLDSVQSFNENKEFSNAKYWKANLTNEEISSYWFFANNGQGDLWLFDKENNIHFYDHDQEEMSPENFLDTGLNFEKWLQFADINNQLDTLLINQDKIDKHLIVEYEEKLKEISITLLTNYPFNYY
jgi:hypothetical protein